MAVPVSAAAARPILLFQQQSPQRRRTAAGGSAACYFIIFAKITIFCYKCSKPRDSSQSEKQARYFRLITNPSRPTVTTATEASRSVEVAAVAGMIRRKERERSNNWWNQLIVKEKSPLSKDCTGACVGPTNVELSHCVCACNAVVLHSIGN